MSDHPDGARLRQAQRSSSWLGPLLTSPGSIATGLVGLGGGAVASAVLFPEVDQRPNFWGIGFALLCVLVTLIVVRGVAELAARRAHARQLAFVAAQPFPVTGYERALGEHAMDVVTLHVLLASTPGDPAVAELAAGLRRPDVDVSIEGERVIVKHRAVAGRQNWIGSVRTPATNNAFRRWFRGPVWHVVEALHLRGAVAAVEVLPR